MLYKAGRFFAVRRAYSALQHRLQRGDPEFYKARLKIPGDSIFEDVPVETTIEQLQRNGISLGLQISRPLVDDIRGYAMHAPCSQPGVERTFVAAEVKNGRTVDGCRVNGGVVKNVEACGAVQKVARDPRLLAIVKKYLNYWPNSVSPRLKWSFASNRPESARSKQYHYDVKGYNFMAAFFFLTETSDTSGAHVMIKRSHRKKPLQMLFHTGYQSTQVVRQHFRPEDELTVSGEAGFGFVEDNSCLHRMVHPSSNRLIFMVRYA